MTKSTFIPTQTKQAMRYFNINRKFLFTLNCQTFIQIHEKLERKSLHGFHKVSSSKKKMG